MAEQIPESHLDLVQNANFATVGTVNPDGSPQLTVVWVAYEDGELKFSTQRHLRKAQNLLERPQVSLLVIDPKNGYRYLEVRGTVSITHEGGVALIDRLAKKYFGRETYHERFTDQEAAERDKAARVVVTIHPEHVIAAG